MKTLLLVMIVDLLLSILAVSEARVSAPSPLPRIGHHNLR